MANTIKSEDGNIHIEDIDSDWSWLDEYPYAENGQGLDSIQFNPGAAGDICVFYHRSTAGVPIFKVKCENEEDEKCKYFHGKAMKPVFDFSASTISAGAELIIIFS